MKVYRDIESIAKILNPIVTIGNFDGVHRGHVHVLEYLTDQESEGYESVVITFWPHPRSVLQPGSDLRFLTSIDEKIDLLRNAGIKHLLIIPFTKQMSEMPAREFVEKVLISKIGARKIILGYDHRFGKDRVGGLDFLISNNDKFNFFLQEIPKKEIENIGISSSQIKTSLESGKLEEAKILLGRSYNLTGTVVEGDKLGRTMGFPTANIKLLFSEKLIPKTGVYAVNVELGPLFYKGMMNIGYRPTVEGKALRIEVNIFDFSEDIYNKLISVELISYLRPEQKFHSLDALKNQLSKDKNHAMEILKIKNDK